MSMWVNVVSINPDKLDIIKKSPEILDKVFFEEDENIFKKIGISENDITGFDYLSLNDALSAIAEAMGEEESEPDFSPSGELDYDAGYGNAEYLKAESLAETMKNDTWSMAIEMDEDFHFFIESAIRNKKMIIWIIS